MARSEASETSEQIAFVKQCRGKGVYLAAAPNGAHVASRRTAKLLLWPEGVEVEVMAELAPRGWGTFVAFGCDSVQSIRRIHVAFDCRPRWAWWRWPVTAQFQFPGRVRWSTISAGRALPGGALSDASPDFVAVPDRLRARTPVRSAETRQKRRTRLRPGMRRHQARERATGASGGLGAAVNGGFREAGATAQFAARSTRWASAVPLGPAADHAMNVVRPLAEFGIRNRERGQRWS